MKARRLRIFSTAAKPLIAILTFALLLVSCSAKRAPEATGDLGASAPASSVASAVTKEGGEYAFWAVAEWLWREDPGLNGDIRYLSADLGAVDEAHIAALTGLLEDFCAENALTLLTMDYDTLVKEGYVEDLYFADGVLLAFEQAELTDNRLTVTARKWRSGLGAIGADFTVEKQGGGWTVVGTQNSWIS